MTEPRAWRQLAQTVPRADTPAQTAALRSALVMMLHDEDYPEEEKQREVVTTALSQAGWTAETRQTMIVLVQRWSQGKPFAKSLMQAITRTGEEREAPRPQPQETRTMATITPIHSQDNESRSMADVYGDPKARQALYEQKELMQASPYNTPPSKLQQAFDLVNKGHVTIEGTTITVKGSDGDKYQIVDDRCNCGRATAGGKREALKWNCQHSVAATLHQRTQAALQGLAAPSLFPLPPSTEQAMSAHMTVHPHTCPICEREWECSALCAVMGSQKRCPTCASIASQETPGATFFSPQEQEHELTRPAPTTIEEALERGGWSYPPASQERAAQDRPGDTIPMQDDGWPEEASQPPLEAPRAPEVPVTQPVPRKRPTIPAEHIELIKGKRHVKYVGLVIAAQEAGLHSLSAEWILNETDLSLAHATAIFADGRRYEECGDATPNNVTPMIKAHFRRVALTRAKARCLRDALGIAEASLEELAEEGEPASVPDMTRTRPTASHVEFREEIKALLKRLKYAEPTPKLVRELTGYEWREENYTYMIPKLKALVAAQH